jgi:2,4-didehydro-3-deoxy-L-rhamnonate hydrolase
LSGVVPDITGSVLSADGLKKIRGVDPKSLPAAPSGTRFGPCIGRVGNFVAVGLNFADHAAETGSPIPAEPILFNKAPSCIVGPNDDVIIPKASEKTDWEVELAIVIGEPASYVHANNALDYVAGYCVCNDVSEREFQLERSGQWMKGKGCPTFGPLGPWLVTKDEIPDVQKLAMWLDVNGQRIQSGSTKTMIFDCAQLVSYISHFMILEPGDVITTGTPPGVGLGMKPPRFLKPGDVVTLGIEGLGEQRQQIVDYHEQATG